MTLVDVVSALLAAYIAGFLSGSTLGAFVRIIGSFLN